MSRYDSSISPEVLDRLGARVSLSAFQDRAARWEAERLSRAGANADGIGEQKKALLLFVLTATYLAFELAFNARLLDVIGTTVDSHDIDQIELWGRLISGCALTLGFWSLAIKANRSMRDSLLAMTLVAGACFAASYFIQERILHVISESATPAQKRAASMLVLATEAVHADDATLAGMNLEQMNRDSPEFKTFMAMFPAMALYTENVEDKTEHEVRALIRAKVVGQMPNFKEMFEDVYLESEVAIKEGWNAYAEGSHRYFQAVNRIPQEQHDAWWEYRRALGKHYNPWNLPRKYHAEARRKVQNKGIWVPYDWNPGDQKTFNRVIREKIEDEAEQQYRYRMINEAGIYVKPGLPQAQFFNSDAVQSKWRKEIGMVPSIPLALDLNPKQFKAQVYEPWVQAIVDKEADKFLAPVETFEAGGRHQNVGDLAVRIAFVPFVAFTFSIIGALFHITKTSWLASKCFKANRKVQLGVCTTVLGATLWYFGPSTITPNPVTETVLFNELDDGVKKRAGQVTSMGIRGLIQFQTDFYPVSEWVRTVPLQGVDFGVAESASASFDGG